MSNRSSIDWLELDRLVDGRLDGDAYRELLCQIDADPDGWRQCAMAFLEHQALTKELSAFAADPNSDLNPLAGAFANEFESDIENSKVEVGSSLQPSQKKGASSMIGWLTMTLCIVGGIGLGVTLHSDFQDRLSPVGIPTNAVDDTFANERPSMTIEDVQVRQQQMASQKEVKESSGCKTQCGQRRCDSQRFTLESRANGDLNYEALEGCGAYCPTQECADEYYGKRGRRR